MTVRKEKTEAVKQMREDRREAEMQLRSDRAKEAERIERIVDKTTEALQGNTVAIENLRTFLGNGRH